MNTQTVEQFIDVICSQLDEKINQEQTMPSSYMTKLKDAPKLIKAQAKASLNTIENRTGLNLLVTIWFTQQFLQYMKELDQEYTKCSSHERTIINQSQLAPFQISLLAKQLALSPGIIKLFEETTNQ